MTADCVCCFFSGSMAKLILVSNDDGIHSPGLASLAQSLESRGEVCVVAPDRERSAASHSLTLSRPLRARQLKALWYSVDGTPTDCVTLGVMGLLPRRPDLVVSGINLGTNLGDDVTYSGTVSAAMEATLLGIPSFAISLDLPPRGGHPHLETAAAFAQHLADHILDTGLPPDVLLNVNVPHLPLTAIRGVSLTHQGKRIYRETIVKKRDPRGLTYYWIGGKPPTWKKRQGSDFDALRRGYISVTPLHLDLTDYPTLEKLQGGNLSRFPTG